MAATTRDIFLLENLQQDDETLSFCDLPIYSDWEADQSLSSSSEDEFFEFSSQGFSASNHEAESIIFCGKLIIPYRERSAAPITTHKLETETTPKQSSKKRSIFDRKSRSRTCPNKVQQVASGVSVLAKSRWYRYMFGVARFPMEMELRDIKERQSRHGPRPMFHSPQNGAEMVRSRSSKGLWGLLRLLGCKSTHHATTVVKSFTCI